MTEQEVHSVERKNEIRANDEPMLWVRAKRPIVVLGWQRFMGETFELPERFALGLVGGGEVEQVIDFARPLNWLQQAPGPLEPYSLPGDFATQGSREGGNDTFGGQPGDLQARQQMAAKVATELQPQQYDSYRTANSGRGASSGEGWPEGATGPTKGAPPTGTHAGTFRGAHPPRRHPSQTFPERSPFRH